MAPSNETEGTRPEEYHPGHAVRVPIYQSVNKNSTWTRATGDHLPGRY